MDKIYFWILILFFIILILDYSDKYFKKKEYFNNVTKSSEKTPVEKLYYEENKLYSYEPPYTTNAININNNKNINFKNFGTNGVTPPFIKCPSCELQYDCSNFPYDIDDNNMTVCTKCNEKILFNDINMKVYAKSVGRPRICKNLI